MEDDIPTVLEYLFANYGKVPTRVVKEKELEVLATAFVPSDPMVTIFWPIEQLKKLAEIAKIPYTESQIVDFGVQLIKNTRDFETALGNWNSKPENDKSWELFKDHFQEAQRTLKDIRGGPSSLIHSFFAFHILVSLLWLDIFRIETIGNTVAPGGGGLSPHIDPCGLTLNRLWQDQPTIWMQSRDALLRELLSLQLTPKLSKMLSTP